MLTRNLKLRISRNPVVSVGQSALGRSINQSLQAPPLLDQSNFESTPHETGGQLNRVALVKVQKSIAQAVRSAFQLAGPPVLRDGAMVAVKLNMCFFRTYETGATTDPRVLEALIDYLRTLGRAVDIVLVESDATSARADLLFRWLGFSELSRRMGVRNINLSNDERVKVSLPQGCFLRALWMPKTLLDCDCLISLAKLKTHGLTKISCSLKNNYGNIPYRGKIKWHPVISKVIGDANAAVKSDFSLVDGIIAMEGVDGPNMGTPRIMNLLVAGKDPVAVDAVCARVMGFDPNGIEHIREAERRGVGSQRCEIVGNDLSEIAEKFEFSRPYFLLGWALRKMRGRTWTS